MSVTYINAAMRRQVVARSNGLCEYCLIAEDDTYYGCEIDHIISEKHGGSTTVDNLAYACLSCNQSKGSDIGSMDWELNAIVRFFNPRTDSWDDHFQLVEDRIEGLSSIGKVTSRILAFNARERILERKTLRTLGRYPPKSAKV